MIEFKEKQYSLKFNLGILDKIERALGQSVMSIVLQGTMTFYQYFTCFGFALFNADGNKVDFEQGYELAQEYIQFKGYTPAVQEMMVAMNEDCPFLFQGD